MSGERLKSYIKQFSKLRVDRSKAEPAPHKPILLLSIIHLINNKEIKENQIFITPELVSTFKDIWTILVKNVKFTANISLPFYHLKSEGFWTLHTYPGKEILLTSSYSIKSFTQLKEAVWYASFDEACFEILMNDEDRATLKQTLLQVYFPLIQQADLYSANSITNKITNQILKESTTVYQQQIAEADEEEIFIRNSIFKKLVPSIYNYTCCISKMRVISIYNIQMIDACHIVPFALSHDDTITNGISLCPNMHRAFDRGLITIDNNYKVMVSTSFSEDAYAYAIKQHAGVSIVLPKEKDHYPSIENLEWHRIHIFRKM